MMYTIKKLEWIKYEDNHWRTRGLMFFKARIKPLNDTYICSLEINNDQVWYDFADTVNSAKNLCQQAFDQAVSDLLQPVSKTLIP